jgi:hypothetical protein
MKKLTDVGGKEKNLIEFVWMLCLYNFDWKKNYILD